jgi:hypothetical protein
VIQKISLSLLLFLLPVTGYALTADYTEDCGNIQYAFSAADIVAFGHVTGTVAKKDSSGNLSTYTTFRVDNYVKGSADRYITIKIKGGQVENDAQTIAAPAFTFGQEGYLYLRQPETAFYEGKYYGVICGMGISEEVPQNSKVIKKSVNETNPAAVNKDSYFLATASLLGLAGAAVILTLLFKKGSMK